MEEEYHLDSNPSSAWVDDTALAVKPEQVEKKKVGKRYAVRKGNYYLCHCFMLIHLMKSEAI